MAVRVQRSCRHGRGRSQALSDSDRRPADAAGPRRHCRAARLGGGGLLRDLPGARRGRPAGSRAAMARGRAARLRAPPGGAGARAIADARRDPPRHPARQRVPVPRPASRSCSAAPGPHRPPWDSRRCSSRPIRRCACRRGAATAASPTMSMRSACCCCAWRLAVRRWRSSTTRPILRRKLELGTYAALAGDERLPPMIGDLVRGMLAGGPRTPAAARPCCATRPARAGAVSRHGRRVGRSGRIAWRAARSGTRGRWRQHWRVEPDAGAARFARRERRSQWLRRGLGDAHLPRGWRSWCATGISICTNDADGDASIGDAGDRVLDPLAPLCWRGMALWPDGIGTALAAAQAASPRSWCRSRRSSCARKPATGRRRVPNVATPPSCGSRLASSTLVAAAREGSGVPRLAYLLNPLMPCASPLVDGHWVARLADLLPALEEAASRVDRQQGEPIDTHVAAFISARPERRMDNDLTFRAAAPGGDVPGAASHAAPCSRRCTRQPLPGVAVWLAARAGPVLDVWRNRERRAAVAERLQELARAGRWRRCWPFAGRSSGNCVE